ncbi:MAG: low molecular weight protein-tyrosine-phosphatase [Rubrimonas sp.]|uniref:low molecular weight protein-tyrosine-phosphatase n=1 Tax=Rubrimonas sp. TaxID=2036015 RepID=UPI002FDDF201
MSKQPIRSSVLMVCLGNICRSPMAQGALEAEAARLGLDLHVESAGTGAWHLGAAPDPRAIAAAGARGCDIAGQRARQVAEEDFRRFDVICAMDADNLAALRHLRPSDATARLSLLLDHAAGLEGEPVPDPYYDGPAAFEEALRLIELGVAGLARGLKG